MKPIRLREAMSAWHEVLHAFQQLGLWFFRLLPMALLTGTVCAFFLWSLDVVTHWRFAHPWLLFLLPVAGVVVGFGYHSMGKPAEQGTNLILDEIHQPGAGVPKRMAPLILLGTLVTHLFGGSAGREGTAVQMGGSIAGGFAHYFGLRAEERRILLMAGVAAGFGAVFGTPIAAAIFAMEVLAIGKIRYDALLPCLMAALLADWACRAWGIGHTQYAINFPALYAGGALLFDWALTLKILLAGGLFGLVGAGFIALSHRMAGLFSRLCPYAPLRPALGGVCVIALVMLCGSRAFLGLGVLAATPEDPTISAFFVAGTEHPLAWLWKMIFTATTLGAGFKGGEVTPLFYIGSGLGNLLAAVCNAPTDLFAALGFVAIFAAATNTPLACTFMGMELFGAAHAVPMAMACFVAYICSGHGSIYRAQRLAVPKNAASAKPDGAEN